MQKVKVILLSICGLVQSTMVMASEAGEKTAMPQLDYSTFPSQIFWLLITFTLLYFLIARSSISKLSNVYEERKNRVDADLKMATSAKQEAERVLKSYEKALADARQQAKELIQSAKKESSSQSDQKLQQVHQKMAQDLSQAEGRIQKIKEDAMKDVSIMAEDLTDKILKKLVGSIENPKLIKETIQQLKAA